MNIRKIFTLLIAFIVVFSFSIIGCAEEVKSTTTEEKEATKLEENTMFIETDNPKDDGLPDASIDDINDWIDRKGFEIIGILQKFVQPFSVIVFIGCAILTLIGAFGNGRLVSAGLLGMVIALIMYAIVIFAPEIMDVFLNWVRS